MGSLRICAIDLDEHLERELSPISLSIAIPNGSLRKPSAKFDLSKIFLQENDCQSQPPICKVARYPLLLQSFICKNEACTIIDVMAAIKFADASAAKTFGEMCGKFSTHGTSHATLSEMSRCSI